MTELRVRVMLYPPFMRTVLRLRTATTYKRHELGHPSVSSAECTTPQNRRVPLRISAHTVSSNATRTGGVCFPSRSLFTALVRGDPPLTHASLSLSHSHAAKL